MAYESLFQPKGFFRDYEPVVLNTHLPKIAETLRGRYDEGVAAKSLLDRAIGSVRTIGNDAQAINRAKMDMDSIINGRVDFENMGKVITDATSRFLTDHSVLNAIDSYSARKKEIEENEQLKAKGVQILDFNTSPVRDAKGKLVKDPDGKPILQHRSDTWDSEVDGIYQRASETKLNWEERALQLLQGIASDSGSIRNAAIAAGVDPSQFGKWLSTGEGVTKGKMEKVADALTDPFLKSQEGIQMFRALTQLEINPETGDMYKPEEAREEVREYLKEVGLKQVGWTEKPFSAWEGDSSGSSSDQGQFDPLKLPENIDTPFSELLGDKEVDKALDLIEGKAPKALPISAPGTLGGNMAGTSAGQSKAFVNAKVKRLNELYSEGRFADAYNPSEGIGSEALVQFAITNPDFAEAFPKLPGESERAWQKRRVNVLKQGVQPYALDLPDQEEARNLIARSLDFGGQLYQKGTGNPARTVEDAVWNESDNSQGPALNDSGIFSDEMNESMRNALAAKKGSVVFIPSGPHAGKFKYHWTHDGTRYSVVTEPVAKMSAAYAPMAKINRVVSSMRPNTSEEVTVNIGNSRHTMEVALVAETKGNSSRLVPMVRHALTGTVEVSPLEDVINYLNSAVLSDMSKQNNQLGRIFRNTNLVREKSSSMPKNE